MKKESIYESITNKIIEKLEKGVIPWKQSWTSAQFPKNLVSGKTYRGINLWLLAEGKTPWWLTYKQAKDLGGSVRKGEKGSSCYYMNYVKKSENEGENKGGYSFLKKYNLFNLSQCDGIETEKTMVIKNSIITRSCEDIVHGYVTKPYIINGNYDPVYYIKFDEVRMPLKSNFNTEEQYFSVLFHELVHSTGSEKRLNRATLTDYRGDSGDNRRMEELIAEMGSSMLCGLVGISSSVIKNQISYIQNWIKYLKNHTKSIVKAASASQKSCDYILNMKKEKK